MSNTKMKKIYFIIDDITGSGGTERVVANLCNMLYEKYELYVISYHSRNKISSFGIENLATIIYLNALYPNFKPKGFLGKLRLCMLINKIIAKDSVVIANDTEFYPFIKKARYIRLEHYNFNFLYKKYRDKKPFLKPRIAFFNTLVTLSSKELPLWQKLHNNTMVIPNFVPKLPIDSSPLDNKIVLSVGRLSKEKGFLRLLDIWKMLKDKVLEFTWLKTFGLDYISQDYSPRIPLELQKSLKLTHGSYLKILQRNRGQYIINIKLTLESPDFILRDTKGGIIFCKAISKRLYFSCVGLECDNHIVIISNAPKDIRNLNNKLESGAEVLYQSPNFGLLRYNKLLQDERSIANKIDSLDSSIESSTFTNLYEWKLIIIGDGILKRDIESKIKDLKLQDSVILKPFTKEIEKEYLESSIYVMSSFFEGFPMVLLEAKSFGLPAIAFDIATGPSDIIEHNKSGYLIENNNNQDFANKILDLMQDEAKRKAFGKNAKEIIKNKFSKEAILPLWEEVLNERC